MDHAPLFIHEPLVAEYPQAPCTVLLHAENRARIVHVKLRHAMEATAVSPKDAILSPRPEHIAAVLEQDVHVQVGEPFPDAVRGERVLLRLGGAHMQCDEEQQEESEHPSSPAGAAIDLFPVPAEPTDHAIHDLFFSSPAIQCRQLGLCC